MTPSSGMFPSSGVITVYTPDGGTKQLSVRCRVGQLYAAQTESPNFNARVGASIYFSLSGNDITVFRSTLSKDDTRITLAADGGSYEVTNVQDHDGFFKCPAVRCKQHGKEWV